LEKVVAKRERPKYLAGGDAINDVLQGGSTRKVRNISEALCGIEISAMQVSLASAKFDKILQGRKRRRIGQLYHAGKSFNC
jgi:hypothetical protein